MAVRCHLCGSTIAEASDADGLDGGFKCADCGEPTCTDCKSIGVGRESNHCRRCRG